MNTLTDDQVKILQDGLDYIVAHPEEWDQGSWITLFEPAGGYETSGPVEKDKFPACGTAACLAGRIGLLNRDKVSFKEFVVYPSEWNHLPEPTTYVSVLEVAYHGRQIELRDAIGLLVAGTTTTGHGYTDQDHPEELPYDPQTAFLLNQLFDANNSIGNLFYYAQELAGRGRITVPEDITPSPYVDRDVDNYDDDDEDQDEYDEDGYPVTEG
jgi:hypothetical protein